MMIPAAFLYYVCLFVYVVFFVFFFAVAGVVVVQEVVIAPVEFPATIRVQLIMRGNTSPRSALIKR